MTSFSQANIAINQNVYTEYHYWKDINTIKVFSDNIKFERYDKVNFSVALTETNYSDMDEFKNAILAYLAPEGINGATRYNHVTLNATDMQPIGANADLVQDTSGISFDTVDIETSETVEGGVRVIFDVPADFKAATDVSVYIEYAIDSETENNEAVLPISVNGTIFKQNIDVVADDVLLDEIDFSLINTVGDYDTENIAVLEDLEVGDKAVLFISRLTQEATDDILEDLSIRSVKFVYQVDDMYCQNPLVK